ncbi:MAG: hypothetical protein ABI778_04205 [Ignavibacteriota bacterium]
MKNTRPQHHISLPVLSKNKGEASELKSLTIKNPNVGLGKDFRKIQRKIAIEIGQYENRLSHINDLNSQLEAARRSDVDKEGVAAIEKRITDLQSELEKMDDKQYEILMDSVKLIVNFGELEPADIDWPNADLDEIQEAVAFLGARLAG